MESLDDVLAKPLETPLTHQEDKLATGLVRRKLAHCSDNRPLQFKTRGQVFIHKITHTKYYFIDNSPSPW